MTVRARSLVVAAAAALLAGCGGDGEPASRTADGAGASPTPVTTPSPTPVATASPSPTPTAAAGEPAATPTPSPAAAEPGGGDEEGIRQEARFVVGPDGRVAPEEVRVAAFLPFVLVIRNASAEDVTVRAPEGEPRALAPGEWFRESSPGVSAGRHPVVALDTGEAAVVAVSGGG